SPAGAMGPLILAAIASVTVVSPNRAITLRVETASPQRLVYSIALDTHTVIDPTPLGIIVDGRNLADAVRIDRSEDSAVESRCRGARLRTSTRPTNVAWALDARVCDDGVALRYVVPGRDGELRTPDEATTFRVPSGSVVWSHDFEGHYEGVHVRHAIEEVAA